MLITDKNELKKYTAEQRIWQGIPSIEVTENGRIYLTFYSGGVKEENGNYCMIIKSDDGVNYSEPIAVAYKDENHRCYDPCLWIDPLGRLWFTWSVAPEHALYGAVCDNPDADELVFGDVFEIGGDVMMNKPIALSTGEWLFPSAVWANGINVGQETHKKVRGSFVYKTTDQGKTFTLLGGADVPDRCFDEHMVLELRDGRIMMLVRTNYGIGVSYSWDRGHTWTRGTDSKLGGPNSRFHIKRLASGRIMLINHINFTGRNNLCVMLSDDECKTWKYSLMLDTRDNVSYPDATERAGYIYITYDRERGGFKRSIDEAYADAREILVSKITEDDIIAGKLVNGESYLARVASKLGKYAHEDQNPFGNINLYSDSEAAGIILRVGTREKILEKLFELYPVSCVNMHRVDTERLDKLIDSIGEDVDKNFKTVTKIVSLVRCCSENNKLVAPVLEKIKKLVEDCAESEMSIENIANQVGISRYYMTHLFKKHTGISICEYRSELKITRAKQMLLKDDLKITDIAYSCGFSSASYFTKRFVQSEGITPNEYRTLNKIK